MHIFILLKFLKETNNWNRCVPGLFSALIFLFLFISVSARAQRDIILRRSIVVKCDNPDYNLQRCAYALLVPADIPGRQEILEYTYPTFRPAGVNKTDANQYYLKWQGISFGELNQKPMEVSIKIRLTVYDLKTAKKKAIINKNDMDTAACLADEENFRSNSKGIKAVAEKIKGGTREEITRNIFYYVDSVLSYHIYLEQDRGAKKALKDGKGDCTEYSELMITLCRARKIPARIVEGLIPRSNGEIGYHNWVEVFFPQYGWVSFDPTWADSPVPSTTFESMKNSYIQLGYKRYYKHLLLPCQGSVPFTLKLRDSCVDLSKRFALNLQQGYKFYNSGQLDKAAIVFDTLIKNDTDNYMYLTLRGGVYARQGIFDKALLLINKAISKAETSGEKSMALYALANYYALKNEGEPAVKALRDALDMGFDKYDHLYKDADFEKIKNYQPFTDLIKELKEKGK